jgi:hypothetical protein
MIRSKNSINHLYYNGAITIFYNSVMSRYSLRVFACFLVLGLVWGTGVQAQPDPESWSMDRYPAILEWSGPANPETQEDLLTRIYYWSTVNPIDAEELFKQELGKEAATINKAALASVYTSYGHYEAAANALDFSDKMGSIHQFKTLLVAARLSLRVEAYYQAEQYLQQAIMLVDQQNDVLNYARWLKWWGVLLISTERSEEGIQQLQMAQENFTSIEAPGEEAWTNIALAQAYLLTEQSGEASGILDTVEEQMNALNDDYGLTLVELLRGDLNWMLGRTVAASNHYKKGVNIANGIRTTYLETMGQLRLGELYTALNNYESGVSHIREAKALVERKAYTQLNADVEMAFSELYKRFNAFKTSSEHLDKAEALQQETGRLAAVDRLALLYKNSGIQSEMTTSNASEETVDSTAAAAQETGGSGVGAIWLWLALAGIIGSGYLYWMRFEDRRKHKDLIRDKNRLISQLDQMNNDLRSKIKDFRANESGNDEELEQLQVDIRRLEDEYDDLATKHDRWMKLLGEVLPHWYAPIKAQLEEAEIKQSRGRRSQQADWMEPVAKLELLLMAVSEWAQDGKSVDTEVEKATYPVDLRTWFEDTRTALDRLSEGLDASLNYHFDLQAMVDTNPEELSKAVRLLTQSLMMKIESESADGESEEQPLTLSVEAAPDQGEKVNQVAVKIDVPSVQWNESDLADLVDPFASMNGLNAQEQDQDAYWANVKTVIQRICIAAAQRKIELAQGDFELRSDDEGLHVFVILDKADYGISSPDTGPDLFSSSLESEEETVENEAIEAQTESEEETKETDAEEAESELDESNEDHPETDDSAFEESESEGEPDHTEIADEEESESFDETDDIDETTLEDQELAAEETDVTESETETGGSDQVDEDVQEEENLGDQMQEDIKNWLSNAGEQAEQELLENQGSAGYDIMDEDAVSEHDESTEEVDEAVEPEESDEAEDKPKSDQFGFFDDDTEEVEGDAQDPTSSEDVSEEADDSSKDVPF